VDRWPRTTALAATGLTAGAVMAVAGLPPVDLHGPLHYLGIMDPLCGGTRSVRLALRGQWAAAWRYNPLGVPLVVGAVLLVLRAACARVTGRWLTVHIGWTGARRRATRWAVAALFVVLEVNQQSHAALLLAHR
jgi:hypothetical protein